MPPLLLTALISILGPQLLGRLFGGGGGQEELRDQVQSILSPKAISRRTNALQADWYKSPAFGAAQEASLTAGRQAEQSVGRAGAGVTSGVDVLRGAAAAGLGSATLGQFNAQAYAQSRELAQRQAEAAASGVLGVGARPNIGREMFGASLNFLGPLLAEYLRNKFKAPQATLPATNQSYYTGTPAFDNYGFGDPTGQYGGIGGGRR